MLGYILRRLVSAALVLLVTSIIVFALFLYGPSDPSQALCSANRCTPQTRAMIHRSLGLDQPTTKQYIDWAKGIFVGRNISYGPGFKVHCDAPCLGISYISKEPVFPLLMRRFPVTLSISLAGFSYLSLGVLVGVLAARKRGTLTDRGLVASSLLLSAVPDYLVVLLAYIFFVLKWGLFPDTTYVPISQDPLKWAAALSLPWLVLTLNNAVDYARFSRGSMIDALGEDYVRTARSKGLGEVRVVVKHALRAAVCPVVTIFGLDFATLLSGTIFTEKIFDLQGIGLTSLQSISQGDLPIISATVLIGAFFIVVANLTVDIMYSFLDPRVRL
jgi:peptide/nickel transport system permease protein